MYASRERADFCLYMCGNFNCSGCFLSHLGPVAPILLHWVPHPRVVASSCLIMVCLTATRYTYHYYCSFTALILIGQTFSVRTKRILSYLENITILFACFVYTKYDILVYSSLLLFLFSINISTNFSIGSPEDSSKKKRKEETKEKKRKYHKLVWTFLFLR